MRALSTSPPRKPINRLTVRVHDEPAHGLAPRLPRQVDPGEDRRHLRLIGAANIRWTCAMPHDPPARRPQPDAPARRGGREGRVCVAGDPEARSPGPPTAVHPGHARQKNARQRWRQGALRDVAALRQLRTVRGQHRHGTTPARPPNALPFTRGRRSRPSSATARSAALPYLASQSPALSFTGERAPPSNVLCGLFPVTAARSAPTRGRKIERGEPMFVNGALT